MRELTMDEIDSVSGGWVCVYGGDGDWGWGAPWLTSSTIDHSAGFIGGGSGGGGGGGGGFWSGLLSAFHSVGDFLGFDGQFGYQGGGGGLSLGGFFGAVSGLTGLGFLQPEGVSIGLGHEDGVEGEAKRSIEEVYGAAFGFASATPGGSVVGTNHAHTQVDAADFFSSFMATGIHNLNEAAIQGYPLSSDIPSGEIRLSGPHYSLTDPAPLD